MMSSILLICPPTRQGIHHLCGFRPLTLLPIVGQTVLEYWMAHAAESGFKGVLISTDQDFAEISSLVGNGERWGLGVELLREPRELTVAQALLKYGERLGENASDHIFCLDRLPGRQNAVTGDYGSFFQEARGWIARASTSDRVDIREIKPGIFAGLRTVVSPTAQLTAPCWIGSNVHIANGAIVGPGAILEAGCFVEEHAEILETYVGPDTLVGRYAQISNSIVWGNTVIDWTSDSVVEVPDPFLLCALRPSRFGSKAPLLPRLAELCSRNKAEVIAACKHLLLRKES